MSRRFGFTAVSDYLDKISLQFFESRYSRFSLLIAFHLFVMLLRILYAQYGPLELYSEEAQYWIWSRHLQLSYYSKPPLIAYLNWISTAIWGPTPLGIRFNAILIGFGVALASYHLTLDLFNNRRTATIASLLTYAMPLIWVPSFFFTTDSPLLLLWLLSLLYFQRAVKSNSLKNWIYFGISFGLGILSKYAILFLLPCLFIYILRTDSTLLRNKRLYIGFGIGLLFFLPVFIWNYQNNFVSFRHLEHLTGANDAAVPFRKILSNLTEYLVGQIAVLSPFFIVFYYQMLKSWRRKQLPDEMVFLILPALLVFAVFSLIAFTRRSGVNVNWPMFAYAAMPVALAHWVVTRKRIGKLVLGALSTVLLLLLISNFSLFDKVGIQKIVPVKFDPVKRISGWQDLAHHVDSIIETLPSSKYFIFSDSYHISSELQFYMKDQPNTYFLNYNNRKNQFSLWPGLEQFVNKDHYGLFVSYHNINKKLNDSFGKQLSFSTEQVIYRGTKSYNFKIYVLKDYNGIEERNSNY